MKTMSPQARKIIENSEKYPEENLWTQEISEDKDSTDQEMLRMDQGRLNKRVFDRIREYKSVGGYVKQMRKVKNNRQKLPGQ